MGGSHHNMKASNAKVKGNSNDILSTINEEIISLYAYLEKHNVSGSEMDRLLEPLIEAVEGSADPAGHQEQADSPPPVTEAPTRSLFAIGKKLFRVQAYSKVQMLFFVCALLTVFGYISLQIPFVSKMMSVLGRQILLLLLPYWDWSRLYYSDCAVTNPFYVSQTLTVSDCNICESLESVEVLSALPVTVATDEFLRNDRPFVVTDAMRDWPVMNTDDFYFDNITDLYRSSELSGIYPCELTSNLRLRPDDLQTFLRRIHLPAVERWYGHWENCDKRGAKALRGLYQRPYFIPHMVDFSDTNWVLMSSDYKAKVYKELRYQSEVLWVGALRGWWHIRVVPRSPCNQHCPELTVTLMEGHIVVVTNLLWKLEYIPGEETDNLAIAVGGFWN